MMAAEKTKSKKTEGRSGAVKGLKRMARKAVDITSFPVNDEGFHVRKYGVGVNVEIPGQEKKQKRETKVNFRLANDLNQALALCGGDASKVMRLFNAGRWAAYRTQVANALSGKSDEQKAVDKLVAAYKTLNPALSDEQVMQLILNMPGTATAVQKTQQELPAEISDTYFADVDEEEEDEEEPVTA